MNSVNNKMIITKDLVENLSEDNCANMIFEDGSKIKVVSNFGKVKVQYTNDDGVKENEYVSTNDKVVNAILLYDVITKLLP